MNADHPLFQLSTFHTSQAPIMDKGKIALSWANSASGAFVRQTSAFRNWVRRDGSTPFTPEAGRYHL